MGALENCDSSTHMRLLRVFARDLLKDRIATLTRPMGLPLVVAVVPASVALVCFMLGWIIAGAPQEQQVGVQLDRALGCTVSPTRTSLDVSVGIELGL
jgi:hypothetical protein